MKKISAILLMLASFAASASDIRIIVPFTAGGATDLVARKYAKFVENTTADRVVVENLTGAGSIVGTKQLLASSGNVVMLNSSSFYVNLVKKTFTEEEFKVASILGEIPMFLATPAHKNLTCEILKSDNRPFFIGDAGKDSITSVPSSFVSSKFKNYTEVPYKGIANALHDLIAGRLDVVFVGSFMDRPDIKILANTSKNSYRGVPSIRDCLGISQYSDMQFILVTNKSADPVFIKRLNDLAIKFIEDEDAKLFLKDKGILPIASNLQSTETEYKNQMTIWKNTLK